MFKNCIYNHIYRPFNKRQYQVLLPDLKLSLVPPDFKLYKILMKIDFNKKYHL